MYWHLPCNHEIVHTLIYVIVHDKHDLRFFLIIEDWYKIGICICDAWLLSLHTYYFAWQLRLWVRKWYPMSIYCRWSGHQPGRRGSNCYYLLMYFHDVYIYIHAWIYWPWEPWELCEKFITIDACAWAWKWIYSMYNNQDMKIGVNG